MPLCAECSSQPIERTYNPNGGVIEAVRTDFTSLLHILFDVLLTRGAEHLHTTQAGGGGQAALTRRTLMRQVRVQPWRLLPSLRQVATPRHRPRPRQGARSRRPRAYTSPGAVPAALCSTILRLAAPPCRSARPPALWAPGGQMIRTETLATPSWLRAARPLPAAPATVRYGRRLGREALGLRPRSCTSAASGAGQVMEGGGVSRVSS